MSSLSTLDDWMAREAVGFSLDSPGSLNVAVDRLVGSLGESVDLLGLGEPMHGAPEFLLLRNRLFERLVDRHGFTAIAIESSFPRGFAVDDYIAGCGSDSFEPVRDAGFSHGFGAMATTRDLVEWMRAWNADPSHATKLRFYGFDSPTEMTGTDSPRKLLHFALDYLASIDGDRAVERRKRFDDLLGADVDWENPAAMMDPSKSIGLSPAATALRIETEELITELRRRRPELVVASDAGRFLDAERHATLGRQMLTYHAGLAWQSESRLVDLLGLRDLMMAENLAYILSREQQRGRGKVLAFAHNSHLKRGQAKWQLGPHALSWWPAGAQVGDRLGSRYAVIGAGVGASESHGIARPEAGTLEARLTATAGPARFIATRRGEVISESEVATITTRSSGAKNSSYFPLTAESLRDFDALVVLDAVA